MITQIKLPYLFLFLIVFLFPAYAQEHHEQETSSEVTELWEFHEVIYQIWHDAWPAKNTELLKELITDIDQGFAKLEKAQLPPILHEKQEKWSQGIENMNKTIDTYKSAAANNDSTALLKAAEDLHTNFEFLVRTIRPVLKEIEEFHKELYMLYHYYMPDYDYDKIKNSVKELVVKMENLNKAQLPRRLKDNEEQFNQARLELSDSVKNLEKVVLKNPGKEEIVAAIEAMHTKYQGLEELFN
jgi:uncharacterized protein YeeX (DUF496 family)